MLAAIIGLAAGLGAIVFDVAEQNVRRFALEGIAGYAPPETAGDHRLYEPPAVVFSPVKLLAVMGVGGLLSGLLVYWLAPEAEGHGTDAAILRIPASNAGTSGRLFHSSSWSPRHSRSEAAGLEAGRAGSRKSAPDLARCWARS